MRTSSSLLALIALVPAVTAGQATQFVPPTAIIYHTDFDAVAAVPELWRVDAGAWSANGGSYNSTSTAPATSTLTDYTLDPIGAPQETIGADYTFRARVRNQGAGVASLAGVVFDYVDAANYNEAVFAPTGTYVVRQVRDGTGNNLLQGTYNGAGQNVWFDVEVIRKETTVVVHVNGINDTPIAVGTGPQFGGRLGVTSRNTTARFDKVSVAKPFDQQPFKQDFTQDGLADWFTTGTWVTGDGTARNTSVQQTSTAENSVIGIVVEANSTTSYMLRARMLNPYGAAGNLVGLIFNDGSAGHGEVLFSPRGVARIDLVHDGVAETIATAPYPGRRNEWFDVRADVDAGIVSVAVNGTMIFDQVHTGSIFEGFGGLITHWAPGRFDDVWFDNRSTFAPLSVAFDSAPPADWIVSGTWNANGGMLNDVSAGVADIVTTHCACWETDFAYRARLLNQYAGSGNLVGLVYNYQRHAFSEGDPRPYVGLYNGDYYEVVFAPTGQAFINKVINGVRYRVATGTHTVPRNVWFTVEVVRQGTNTSVKVNGATVFANVPQGELPFGDVGVVSHWSKARFDDLTVADAPLR